MNDNIKSFLVKFSIVIAGVSLVGFIVIPFVLACFDLSVESIIDIWEKVAVIPISTTIIMVILMHTLKFSDKPIQPEVYPLEYPNYEAFFEFLNNSLNKHSYFQLNSVSLDETSNVSLFIKKLKNSTLEAFVIIRASDLTANILEHSNNSITNILSEYYGTRLITDTVDMISVFCVDRITPDFKKILNYGSHQSLKNGRLLIGISFGGKKIYVSKNKNGYYPIRYKRLKNTFLSIMDQSIKPL